MQAGSSWVENCTRYDCVETSVGAVILASGVICPPFNDTDCIQVRTVKICPNQNKNRFLCNFFLLLTVSKHQQSNISLGCKFLSEYYFLFLFVSSSCRVEALFKAMWMVAARLVSLKITFLILVLCLLQLVRGVNALLPGSGWAYWLKRLRAWPFLEGLRCSPVADDILKSLAFTGVLQILC